MREEDRGEGATTAAACVVGVVFEEADDTDRPTRHDVYFDSDIEIYIYMYKGGSVLLAMALSKRDRVAGVAPLIASTIMISFSLRHVSGLLSVLRAAALPPSCRRRRCHALDDALALVLSVVVPFPFLS